MLISAGFLQGTASELLSQKWPAETIYRNTWGLSSRCLWVLASQLPDKLSLLGWSSGRALGSNLRLPRSSWEREAEG